ncbi:helix-turn-helix transcriptional regulator [Pseudonocardia sp. KRD-184]|uniref:Helix-turn-helix transcriptional regulator n=1 Tax=Pseudonocardia oceani TaxID=2792013 RepID=A0ABS6U563_9PSEU|nr:helix-turn-helix transcriptional regulator [Pseudonocardia oceani]MBW0091296.1 helix-turn-helix transcriptional regulator [Pseudonocardia oceani]MBW0097362.1 helix-turn-helix transcriptional regulator [Pseudonocardia oceani]MBW0110483.1 helix-turn-helix transcriptional regulator [Pseudonocardia oceani]MBW0124574.1 helix-turn-helix transcriptional regulator [Pseudonocardia oceani]MBW0127294.1 helix-turn-helix transcriptional regulator [Pseudonocardia oceani]
MTTATRATGTTASAFGSLLRDWRQRRRLTQLDLGLAADVSARHLSFLETGRSRPSREMVLHLSEELDVPLRARNELMSAAGFAPAYSHHDLGDAEMDEVRASLQRILDGHSPYPAVLVDGMWNLLASNAAVSVLTELVDPSLLTGPTNIVRLALHPRGLARHVVDLPEYAAHLVSRLRRQAERSATTGLRALLAEAVEHCRVRGLDASAQPRDRIVLPLRLRHPDGELTFFSTVAVLGAPLDVTLDEVCIESFFPGDAATADYLRRRVG